MLYHIWLVSVRLKMSREGKEILQELIDAFFLDCESKMIGAGFNNPFALSATLKDYGQKYLGCFLSFEEGLKTGDVVLAEAFWRNIFAMKFCTDVETLKILVQYTHQQLSLLFDVDHHLLTRGLVKFGDLPKYEINLEEIEHN